MSSNSTSTVGIAIIGAGAVSDFHHTPGIKLDPRAELVAICDPNRELLLQRQKQWGVEKIYEDFVEVCQDDRVDAVIIATPNFTHLPIAIAAATAGKHLMCEKPLGINAAEVQQLYETVNRCGVVHMTAFTYRFAPAMRYIRHLVHQGDLGQPRHFRSQRFMDLPETSWGWRQYKSKAGAGDLYDMTIHRIDFAMDLLGPIKSVCGALARFAQRTKTDDGQSCPPSEIDDWSSLIAEFQCGATGVWEGTTLAKGYHRKGFYHEWAEVNGSEGSAVYQLHCPHTILLGREGGDLEEVQVPKEFLKPEASPRDLDKHEPSVGFRYDLVWEFVSAIVEGRSAVPSFLDGLNAQLVADAVIASFESRRWIEPKLINGPEVTD